MAKFSKQLPAASALATAVVVSACGGGGSSTNSAAGPTDAQRVAAATTTADNNPNCAASVLGPFYWEVGDSDGVRVAGTVGVAAPAATTMMSIASASKWLYSSYVVERVGVRSSDVPFLNFTSGYSMFGTPLCPSDVTVEGCLVGRDGRDPGTIGKFFYDSGHMQHHAAFVMNLGSFDNAALTAELGRTLGNFGFIYTQPQLAGGVAATASGYGAFLRKVLRNELAIAGVLGTHAVCTNPNTCTTAVSEPAPDTESRHYSLGHWVEDDPAVGDGAFSSAGAFGFYPWIDRTKTYYGVLAREQVLESEAGYHSAQCGRMIRQAWVTGVATTNTTPTP